MSGFVAAPTDDSTEGASPVISNANFWPDIDPAKLREAMRIDETVPAGRLRHAAIEAMSTVNGQLRNWRQKQLAAGFAALSDVPAENIDGISELVGRYRRAVYCFTKANLLERIRDLDTTAAGNKRAEQQETTVDDLRRDGNWAVSDILARARTVVDLI